MKSKTKKSKSKQNIFKPTFKKIVIIVLVLQSIAILILSYFTAWYWAVIKDIGHTQTIQLINNTLDNLYQDASKGSITEYQSGVTKWPELGIKLPYDTKYSTLYISGYTVDGVTVKDLQITNDLARSTNQPIVHDSGDMLLNYFESLPYLQACSRLIITVGSGEDVGMDDYKFEFSKTLQDGRSLDFYSNNKCNPELKNEFISYLKQIESL